MRPEPPDQLRDRLGCHRVAGTGGRYRFKSDTHSGTGPAQVGQASGSLSKPLPGNRDPLLGLQELLN